MSHTGNIAGSYMAYHAAFKQAKVIEAQGLYELFDIVKIFSQPKPKGNRVGVITNGGGVGIITADCIERRDLLLGKYSENTRKEIAKILPSYGNVGNPLDLVADSGVEAYSKAIDVMMTAPEIDILAIVVLTQTPPIDERIIHVLTKASDDRRKPIVTISIGGVYTEAYRKILESNGVPSYNSPNAAIEAVERLVTYSRYCKEIGKC
jgi:acyl-CoA synthetase (NDP forming)